MESELAYLPERLRPDLDEVLAQAVNIPQLKAAMRRAAKEGPGNGEAIMSVIFDGWAQA